MTSLSPTAVYPEPVSQPSAQGGSANVDTRRSLSITVFHSLVRTSSQFIFYLSVFPPLFSSLPSPPLPPSFSPFFHPLLPSFPPLNPLPNFSFPKLSSPLTCILGWHLSTSQSLRSQCLNQVLKVEQPDVDTRSSDLLKLWGNTSADVESQIVFWTYGCHGTV